MTTCAALRCTETDIRPHVLRERSGDFDYPRETVLCAAHIAAVTRPGADWVYDEVQNPLTGGTSRAVLIGNELGILGEYVVEELKKSIASGSHSRTESSAAEQGRYLTLQARRRGDAHTTELKLQVPRGRELELAKQLEAVADLLRTTDR